MIDFLEVISVGPEFTPLKGGIAQCVATYQKTVFKDFRYVANSCNGSVFKKAIKMFVSIFQLFILLLLDKRIRIVHIHTASNNSFKRSAFFVRIAKVMGRKVIMHIHGGGFKDYYDANKVYVYRVLSRCEAIVTLSYSWKEFYQNTVGLQNVFVIPNIISEPILKNVTSDGKFHLLYLGHICKAKGIFDLVELLHDCHNEYVGKLVLDIGGGMYEEEELRAFIKDNKLENLISFHGWVSGSKKSDLLNKADAFILPSYTEGVPISVLEAESYGLPILSTNVGGIPEIVSNEQNGFLFHPGQKNEMKDAIDKLLKDSNLCAKMGDRSRQIVLDNLPNSVEDKLKKMYKIVLNK